jgi:propionyl-CoA synthetase
MRRDRRGGPLKGQLPLGLLCVEGAAVKRDHDEIAKECVKLVREQIGPVAAFKTA